MRTRDETECILDLAFSDARELEQLARRFRQRKLTREQFIAGVEEIAAKLRQSIVAILAEDDVLNEDIPF